MEGINPRQAKGLVLKNVLAALARTIHQTEQLKKLPSGETQFEDVICFALIKAFETTMEVFWKFLRVYMGEVHGVEPVSSPRGTLNQAHELKIFSRVELEQLLDMLDDRNEMVHTYDATAAEDILELIPHYHMVLGDFIDRLCA